MLGSGSFGGGIVRGSSDVLGERVAEDEVGIHDFQTTIPRRLNSDHERLTYRHTYRHTGRDFRLADVHGRAMHEIPS